MAGSSGDLGDVTLVPQSIIKTKDLNNRKHHPLPKKKKKKFNFQGNHYNSWKWKLALKI